MRLSERKMCVRVRDRERKGGREGKEKGQGAREREIGSEGKQTEIKRD